MSISIKNKLKELLSESVQFNTNDVLVNINKDNKLLVFNNKSLSFELNDFPKKIILEAKKNKKESGINSLCETHGTVEHLINGKIVQTPILICPLEISINKFINQISFTRSEEDEFINPFLLRHINKSISGINSGPKLNKENIFKELELLGLSIKNNASSIGNFHHHRYYIVKELEELLTIENPSINVLQLFGEEQDQTQEIESITRKKILESDTDHELVFKKAAEGNIVIQGPPGTGKSQVLTNLISKYLYKNKTSIIVSEKRVALEVIKKKLSHFGLDKYSFIASSNKLSHSFLKELKETWDYLESTQECGKKNLLLSDQYLDNLQMSLDMLNKKNLIGGDSYTKFKELSSNHNLAKYKYNSDAPSIDSFLKVKDEINNLYKLCINPIISNLKINTIKNENFDFIDKKINFWIEQLKELSTTFQINTWSSFSKVKKQAVDCQIFENETYKKYRLIFEPGSKEQKKFFALYKSYLSLKIEVEFITKNQSHWKIIPSEKETEFLLKEIKEFKSFFKRRKIRRRWIQISNTDFCFAKEVLIKREKEITTLKKQTKNLMSLCKLGINDPEENINIINLTLNQFSQEKWRELYEIKEEVRLKITSSHNTINEVYNDLKMHFNFDPEINVIKYLNQLQKEIGSVVSAKHSLSKLNKKMLNAFKESNTFIDYEGVILKSHFVKFKERFPFFSSFKSEDLRFKVLDIQKAYNEEQRLFSLEIENNIINKFNSYHKLLNRTTRKLNEEQKQLKKILKKGKSILIKEFGKTRSHPSLRQLQQSEAKIWIDLLKPIWLSNPSQVSNCFPLKENIFDVAIFDEASQIPIQNGLGTIHRAKKIIIAGDENQMGPSNYFVSKDIDSLDLLHQANYNWPSVKLKHHYRSVHPDLIAFSNQFFYNNELTAYPERNADVPIRHHYISKGKFINRKNKIEAIQVAKQIHETMRIPGSIGVVAFSEEQLSLIWSLLSSTDQNLLTEKIESNNGFFKSLENVQGDECDFLIISFGYGKNEDNLFMMHFGPMNRPNGRKRLNVLLTRAKKTIDFFCSINSSDFKLTDNESINLMRKWVSFSESYKNQVNYLFPINNQPIIQGQEINFKSIHKSIPSAKELHTFTTVLSKRGWDIRFQ
ncbi:MAG: hypothetical protein CL844_10010 [Crocinitomicaceae bacterium]|nr:hypothetical protein [Crocinitomicaceae bacterium]